MSDEQEDNNYDDNVNFTFINELGEDGEEDHVYIVGCNYDPGGERHIARLFGPGFPGVQTYTSSEQLAEFGMLCFALAPLEDIDSIGELIDGCLGESKRIELANRLRELADNLEE